MDGTTDGATELLRDIIDFMVESCTAYDRNCEGEASRLATCIKILAHDTDRGRSVLGRLGLKNIPFKDYSHDYNPSIGLPFCGMAVVTIGKKTSRYMPRLDDPRVKKKDIPFDAWWSKQVIVDEERGVNLTRGSVVVDVAVSNFGIQDAKLNERFDSIIKRAPHGAVLNAVAEFNPDYLPAEYASVRHIAFEVIETVKAALPDLQ